MLAGKLKEARETWTTAHEDFTTGMGGESIWDCL